MSGQQIQIVFDSAGAVEAAGIDIASVWPTELIEQVAGAGEVRFDPARVARVSAKTAGVARRVMKGAGESVRGDEVLALVESAEVGKAKAEFQQALVQARHRERARDDLVGAKTAASQAAVREAEAAVKESAVRVLAAAQTLTNLGLPIKPDDYHGLTPADAAKRIRRLGVEDANDQDGLATNLLPVRAPFAGVVLATDTTVGEVIEPGKTLFTVVDASRVWITLHVGQEDARRVQVGQKVFFRPDGEAREHAAAVVWVGAAADETTRTVPVRAEAENPNGSLRASVLGRGRVVFRQEPKAVVVPHRAVHRFRDEWVVFVRDPEFLKPNGPKTFHVRAVQVGGKDERHTEILAGVSRGEIVATTGSDGLLKELAHAISGR
ncbi:MAG: efflux RND transporter periplasmic adaptor subunit [Gemmataceae bacterium]